MTYHIAICNDDSRDAGYVSELLHQWAQLRGCAVTEHRFPSAEGFLFRYEEDRSFDRLKRRDPIWGPAASRIQGTGQKNVRLLRALSPEARSYPGRTAHGSAGGGRSAPPAPRCWIPPGSSPAPSPGTVLR